MCGLVGIYSIKDNGFTVDEGKMFEQSMIFNQLRGDDSTGAVAIDKDNIWSFLKSVGGFRSFTRHARFEEWRRLVMNQGKLVFGHGRLATRGNINVENAHPFRLKNEDREIIFMHNGTLATRQSLPGMGLFDVDSEYLGTMIVKHGAQKALSEVDGAMACMWWDITDNTFNFYRNHERPLYYMHLKTGEFYLNSEKWILEFLNWKFKLGAEDKDIYMIKDMDLHSVPINGENAGKYEITGITKAVQIYNRRNRSEYQNYIHQMYDYSGYDEDEHADPYTVSRLAYTAPWEQPKPIPPENKEFWNREINLIEWVDGKKRVTYNDRHVMTHLHEEAPEPHLLRMYYVQQSGNVMKVYQYPGKAQPTYVELKYEVWLAEKNKEAKVEAETKEERKEKVTPPVISVTNQNTIKFTTRHNTTQKKIKHKGIILTGKALPHLEQYENTEDGSVKLGEIKTVELLYAEEKIINGGTSMTKVVCAEMKEKQDTYIDYVFYSSELTKKEVEEIIFFKGLVGSIIVGNDKVAKTTGAYCVCHLQNVRPIIQEVSADSGGPAKIEAANDSENKNEEGKTVH